MFYEVQTLCKLNPCLCPCLVFVLAFSLIPYASAANHDEGRLPEEHVCDVHCLTDDADTTVIPQRISYISCPQCAAMAVYEAGWYGEPQLIDGYQHEDHLDYRMYRVWRTITVCPSCAYSNETKDVRYYGNWCPNT